MLNETFGLHTRVFTQKIMIFRKIFDILNDFKNKYIVIGIVNDVYYFINVK